MPEIKNTIRLLLLICSLLLLASLPSTAQMNRDISTPDEKMPWAIGGSYSPINQGQSVSSVPAINTHSLSYLANPDLTVSADSGQQVCNQVSFTVGLVPSATQPSPSGNQAVRVRVVDKSAGNLQPVAEVLLLVPASGGSSSVTLGLPAPQSVLAGQSLTRELVVIVDPDNEILESNESNNVVTIASDCSAY